MARRFRQILSDFRRRRHLDLYATALVSFGFAVLAIVADQLVDGLRWSLLFAALGVLVLRSALPPSPPDPERDVLLDRTAFEAHPIGERFQQAREVWIFAPTPINLLTAERCEMLRKGPLSRPDGDVRVVVLDESDPRHVELLAAQLEQLLEFPIQAVGDALRESHSRLRAMSGWNVHGSFAYGTLRYSPGFSLVAIDPSAPNGSVVVEFHGFRNDTISSRMHIHLTRRDDGRWFHYWLEQFDAIWRTADRRRPVSG